MRFRRPGKASRLDVPTGTVLFRGRPSVPPTPEALARLREECARHPALRAVYLTQQVIPEPNAAPTLLLGLVAERDADFDAICSAIGDAAFPLRPGDEHVDFTVLSEVPDGDAWQRVY